MKSDTTRERLSDNVKRFARSNNRRDVWECLAIFTDDRAPVDTECLRVIAEHTHTCAGDSDAVELIAESSELSDFIIRRNMPFLYKFDNDTAIAIGRGPSCFNLISGSTSDAKIIRKILNHQEWSKAVYPVYSTSVEHVIITCINTEPIKGPRLVFKNIIKEHAQIVANFIEYLKTMKDMEDVHV